MSTPGFRRVRPIRPTAACPGCGRVVRLNGHLELVFNHTVPEPLDHSRTDDGGRRSRAGQPCPWSGDPMPGRPDGHLSRADAETVAARVIRERRSPATIAS